MNVVFRGEVLKLLGLIEPCSIDLSYVDPPFGIGSKQVMQRKSHGSVVGTTWYDDPNVGYVEWLKEHVKAIHHVLKHTGTLYLHLDWRHVHHARFICDEVFGADNFLNEIIWSYNFGGRGKNFFARKHDNILVYAKKLGQHVFNYDAIPRVPYKAPDMQYVGRTREEAEKRIAEGQVPTDVWEMSIVVTNSKERTGYPTQKPLAMLERIVLASSPPDGIVLDCFAGSGTTGAAAHKHGRSFILADTNQQAIDTMRCRFKDVEVDWQHE